MSVLYHLSSTYTAKDVATFVYRPLTQLMEQFKNHPLTKQLSNFGAKFDDKSNWLVRNDTNSPDNKEDVLLFFHGGGFVLNIFETQFMGILALYYSIPSTHRSKISILILDYSLTCNKQTYPTQIKEALSTYTSLVDQGYKNINIIGDSAGGNLALALSRIISYRKEAKKHFEQFTQFDDFDWNVSLPQPKSLALISPWVQPLTNPHMPPKHGVNVYGDLGAIDTDMAEWYSNGLSKNDINNFINFTNTVYEDHWDLVEPLNNIKRNILIAGEREILRDGIEDWVNLFNNEHSKSIQYIIEKGGIHDCLFYVEGSDYLGPRGQATDLDFTDKFCYNHISQFLGSQIDSSY